MSVLGHVARGTRPALYVVKIGSASLFHERVFDDLAELNARGARVLMVAGGATGVAKHYAAIGRPMPMLRLRRGDVVRHCTPAEMPHITEAYEQVTMPRVRAALAARGLTVFAATAAAESLVWARPNPPVRAEVDGRTVVVRDHLAGTVSGVDIGRLECLLDAFDVVCVSPPVADLGGGCALNVDADVLAAKLATAADADHLRLVTGTPGLLADPAVPTSRLGHVLAGEAAEVARGRMRQKVRAAEIALEGAAPDVAITGPHMLRPGTGTRFWRTPAPGPDLELLGRAVEISSVSGDERELAEYLVDWCTEHGVNAEIDAAGNVVATRGRGDRRLLMLGHLDTVPHRWPARWGGPTLTGRGCVDAKGSLVAFLETLAEMHVPDGVEITVVGAVEEETTSAGAFHVRDGRRADAVIIGEPSGSGALTVGYFGLLKFRVEVNSPMGHTAGHGVVTAADELAAVLGRIRAAIAQACPAALMAVLGVHAVTVEGSQVGEAVVDVRTPPQVSAAELLALAHAATDGTTATLTELRATPGTSTPRTDPLVGAFTRALREEGMRPRYLAKKGSSDMNTLATTWQGVPMVAYGPGDAALDHTREERLHADEFRRGRAVLARALAHWAATPATG